MQPLHSLAAAYETAMQHLHSVVAVCETAMQHLHSLAAVCETTMQHLHSLVAVCETAMQPLHSLAAVCETAMQHLHSVVAVCETAMQPLYSLAAVCAPVPRRLIIRPRLGPSGGRMQFAPTPRVPGKIRSPRRGRMQFAPTPGTRQNFPAPAGAVRRRPRPNSPPIPDAALHLPHPQIFNVYEEQQTTQHNADDGARSADRSAELAAPQATR